MNLKHFLTLLCFLFTSLQGESKYPVDVSFLIADLKYSKEYGVKICEIQHGILSTFNGDTFLFKEGKIPLSFAEIMSEFPLKKWTLPLCIASKHIKSLLETSDDFEFRNRFNFIVGDLNFQAAAVKQPKNPSDISTYHGMLFVPSSYIKSPKMFREMYPGMIVMDSACAPYWIDKYKMSELFNRNTELSSIKPEWRLYPKKYTKNLAQNIIDDLQNDVFVIKPRGAFLGNGVIIVNGEDLDSTLKFICRKSENLKNHLDKSYSYWYKDPFDSFIVENFYPSDEISVPELGNEIYHPTIRAAFILIYNNEKIDFRLLGEIYYFLPNTPVGNEGSLNDIYKTCCKLPYCSKAPDEVRAEVEKQLSQTIPLLYKEMLEGN